MVTGGGGEWKSGDCRRGVGAYGALNNNILLLDMDDGYIVVQFIIILYVLYSLLHICCTLPQKSLNKQVWESKNSSF